MGIEILYLPCWLKPPATKKSVMSDLSSKPPQTYHHVITQKNHICILIES